MGCGTSSLGDPNFRSTPSTDYADTRKKTSQDLLKAHETLLKSTESYAEALESVGESLKTYTNTIVLFDSPARYPPPPKEERDAKKAKREAERAEARAKKEAEGNEEDEEEEEEEEDEEEDLFPAPGVGMQLRHKLEDVVAEMEGVFEQLAAAMTKPVEDSWANKLAAKKKGKITRPPLEKCSEPVGSTVQTLALWEAQLRDEVVAMVSAKQELQVCDKALTRQTTIAAKKVNADASKLQAAQGNKNSAQAKLQSKTASIIQIFKDVETYKTHHLFPQITRMFKDMSSSWRESEALFKSLQEIAPKMRDLNLVLTDEYKHPEEPDDVHSEVCPIPGAATRPYHNATKEFEQSVLEWIKKYKSLNKAQHGYSKALVGWIRASMSVPGEFPKPSEEELNELYRDANGNEGSESSFGALAADWNEAADAAPAEKLEAAVEALREALLASKELQIKQVQHMKDMEKAKKELVKIETRFEKAERMEFELVRAIEELQEDEEEDRAQELEGRERQLDKTKMEVQHCSRGVKTNQAKFMKTREVYANLIVEECNTAGKALETQFPDVLAAAKEFCGSSAKAFKELHAKHHHSKQNGK